MQKQLQAALDERRKHIDALAWFRNADLDTLLRELASERDRRDEIPRAKEDAERNVRLARDRIDHWTAESSVSLNPRTWFSDKSAAKRSLDCAIAAAREAEAQDLVLTGKLEAANRSIRTFELEVKRLHAFDEREAQAAIERLNIQIDALRPQLEDLNARAEKVANLQREPLAALEDLQSKWADTQAGLAVAGNFERALGLAATSGDRARIHEECRQHFEDGSPSAVLRQLSRQLADIDRQILKLEKRLRALATRGALDVAKVVIDGNNLCYRQQTFIGLAAVQSVVAALQNRHEIVVVFDASVRSHLKMDNRRIAASFPEDVVVHVVAHKQTADETVLDVAADADSIVISNDKFVEFPEKPAVRDRRVLRHEIVSGRVYVHELGVNALVQ
jgi:hypothetical protein